MRVALVHDYLIQDGGAERVFLAFHEMFPSAPIFSLFHDPELTHKGFHGATIITSSLNRLPFAPKHYQWYLPFMPQAIESFDFTHFDLVLSSSSTFAKGVIISPEAKHICYCHTPTRFLWQERLSYVNDLPQPAIVKWILPPFLHRMRQWDRLAADRPDHLLTNSRTSQQRIHRYYQRASTVIYPPVDVSAIPLATGPGSYWLAGGRFVAYKKFDVLLRAFSALDLPLKIFGYGPEERRLRAIAGPKTEFIIHADEATKHRLFRDAIGFLNPQMEDCGITAIEAMSAGRPVIAYRKGGATETVVEGVTGQFIDAQTPEAVIAAVKNFDASRFDAQTIRAHAATFSKERFKEQMQAFITHSL
ncbi:MAG: glycosyltransferase [Patescibacteria group bacterium]